ncbi:PREDICTED: prolactin-releasing peptide [Cariama cristata]|nr:PREDICTED: prolactin-releasing peptide [Cariama cristata]
MPLQLTPSFTPRALTRTCSPHALFSSQPSHHCSVMWHPISWTPRAQWSPKHFKLVTVYVLVLLVSLSFASGQSRPFKHQIDNRSPEIDPFWYVGRGVRPIGRFGKRQLSSSRGSRRPVSRHLDFILDALWEQKVSGTEDNNW